MSVRALGCAIRHSAKLEERKELRGKWLSEWRREKLFSEEGRLLRHCSSFVIPLIHLTTELLSCCCYCTSTAVP
ncbi:hypothetical protein P167DRAFT_411978 [Morchella conica CCBAS932]|uniref:Uncharacterized protein n=1 Tax=Morchella conica CCBAS932 TaxID=1392247 RepID=A0A3N4KYV5_9PEZI|nr:hypothetical protein P167DRAFT_411978 [Morchella conica CCBAS932]